MAHITQHETKLSDEGEVRAVLEPVGLPHLNPSLESHHQVQSAIPPWSDSPRTRAAVPRPYWTRYLQDRVIHHKWHNKSDVWLQANKAAGTLRRVVITGLLNEQEAKLVRSEFEKRGAKDLKAIVDEIITSRDRRAYQKEFEHFLLDLRAYFAWQNSEVVESGGRILPISKSSLKPDDIRLLREVFARLPASSSRQHRTATTRRNAFNDLKTARQKVKEKSADVANEGVMAWVNARVQVADQAGKSTRSTALYDDYSKWARSHGDNRGEKAESKRTTLTQKKWGDMMCRLFDRRRDGRGHLYRVTLKRSAPSGKAD